MKRIVAENHTKRNLVVANETLGHVVENFNAYPRTIIDVELLARCNQLVFTGGSTFGFVAAMKSQRAAYYINGRSNMTECKLHELGKPSLTDTGYAVFR